MSIVDVVQPCGGTPPIPLCIKIIGGGQTCFPSSAPGYREALEALRRASDQLNPIRPALITADCAAAIGNFVKDLPTTLPEAITGDIGPLKDGVANVAVKLDAVVELNTPLLAIPGMARGMLILVRNTFVAAQGQIRLYIAQYASLAAKALIAARFPNSGMITVVACARANLDLEVAAFFAELSTIGVAISVVNGILCLIGQQPLTAPKIAGALEDIPDALQPPIDFLNVVIPLVPDVGLSFGGTTC